MKEQQQVPPGIVAFKGIAGNIQTFEKSGVSHYNNWVKWRMQEPNTIHIISVEEIQWSIGDEEEAYGKVESFEYDFDDQRWLMKTNCGTLNVVKCKHKLPPPSQQDRSVSQPGKEEIMKLAIVMRDDYNRYITTLSEELQALRSFVIEHKWIATDLMKNLPIYEEKQEAARGHLSDSLKHFIGNPDPQPSQPGGGWTDTQLKDFAEYCDNHEGNMENLLKQWKSKQAKS